MKTHIFLLVLLLLSLFVIAGIPRFLSLDAHWSSDEVRWLNRSADFMSAVKQGRFNETLIAYHPGVTTMWIAGLRTFFTEPSVDVLNLARARLFISIIIWVGIGIACFLLHRLFGKWTALTSFACLAYSPLFLAQTRRAHTDALATLFILLTVLLFLLYAQNRQNRRYLILSGAAFGLAVLSKSYAVILLLWIPICLFFFRNEKNHAGGLLTYIAEGLCFFNCAAITIILGWPIFWSLPFGVLFVYLLGTTYVLAKVLKKGTITLTSLSLWAAIAALGVTCVRVLQTGQYVLDRVNWAVTTAHEVEHFFLGKVVYDPGWLFYPFVLTIKSTPLMLPLALIGCILLWKSRKHLDETAYQLRMALALIAGVLLFTICLSATSKKFSRYLLPAFPMLEILAAIGLVEGFKWIYIALRARFQILKIPVYKNALLLMISIGLFFIQLFPVLALHPYYGTYYNLCWRLTDITKIITIGEASGLDLAANYLNQKPNPQKLVVQVSPLATEFVDYYFRGYVYRADSENEPAPDYEVVYIRDSQIGRVPQTGTRNGKLEKRITLNGIDHVWIYRVQQQEETQ